MDSLPPPTPNPPRHGNVIPGRELRYIQLKAKGRFKVHAKIGVMALTPSPLSVIMTLKNTIRLIVSPT
jgi:hypothetical protein